MEMKRKISLGNPANQISAKDELNKIKESGEKDAEIIYVPYSEIECNSLNDFPIMKIEQLADDIEKYNFLDPLTIKFNEGSKDKKFRLLGGERRYTAIGLILKRNPDFELFKKGIRCILDKTDLTPVQEEIRIILLNKNRNAEDLPKDFWIKKASRLKELYEQQGVKSNKIVGQIAKDLNVGERQVQRYTNISKNESNILPEIRQAFNESKISIENLSTISSLSKETQENILVLLKEKEKISKKEIDIAKAQTEELQKKLQEQKKEVSELESKNENLEKTIRANEEKANALKERENQMQRELEKVKNQNNNENPKVKELEIKLKELEVKQKQTEEEKKKALESLVKVNEQIKEIETKPKKIELTEEEKKKMFEKYELERLESELSKRLNEFLLKSTKYETTYKETIPKEELIKHVKKLL